MASFILCAGAMLAAALAVLLVPLLRRRGEPSAQATAARRQRALDEALAAGVIDAGEYAAKRAASAPGDATPAKATRAPLLAAMLVALLLPAAAVVLYRLVGAPQALDPSNRVAASTQDGPAPMDMDQAIAGLAARLKDQPDDAQGWALLGRAYQATGRTQESLDALRHAHELAKDDDAVTVEYAQALAVVAPEHRIDGESRSLLDSVLAKDPQNQRALWLVGISDYQAGRYDAAISRWNALLPLLDPGSEVAGSVKQQIADAEAKRAGKDTASSATQQSIAASAAPTGSIAAEAAPTKGTAASAVPAADAPKLTVRISLDATLKDRLDPAATLFVFARAASGPPMPLAIQRLKASQLPLTVTLDESMGMLPNLKLSMFPQVVVGARVSKSGNAMPQSGDLQALSAPIDVHRREPLVLSIDQTVP